MKKIKDTQYLYPVGKHPRFAGNQDGWHTGAAEDDCRRQPLKRLIRRSMMQASEPTYDYKDFESALTQELASTYERLGKGDSDDPQMFQDFPLQI